MSKKLKILSVHWGFSLGGVGKYALLIDDVKKYSPISIKSLCILSNNWQCDRIGLEKLNPEQIVIQSRFDFSWIRPVVKAIRKNAPDLIMTYGFNGHFLVLLTKLLARHDIPLICSYHGLYQATTKDRVLFEKLINHFTDYFIKKHAKSVVSVAEYSKHYLIQKGVHKKKIYTIHNGIEYCYTSINCRTKLRAEWGMNKQNILIGTASRLDPAKGVSYLISAIEKLSPIYENIRLIVIGTGKSEGNLREQVARSGLSEKVIFTGFRSDISDCLEAFDIFVLPSLAESHSISLLEAMRAGKPIVATNVGGNTESVRHLMEGLIVSPADPEELKKAIEKYIQVPEFAEQMSINAKLRFNNQFTADVMVKKTAEWLMSCGSDK